MLFLFLSARGGNKRYYLEHCVIPFIEEANKILNKYYIPVYYKRKITGEVR
jgi:hypothetical protein